MLPIILVALPIAAAELPPLSDLDRFPPDRQCMQLLFNAADQLAAARSRKVFASPAEAEAWSYVLTDLEERHQLWCHLSWIHTLAGRLHEPGDAYDRDPRYDSLTGRQLTPEEVVRTELAVFRTSVGWANYQAGHCEPRREAP